jgi:anti-sigma regulatory factor (Ser/Thr protein kinase)
MPKAKSFSFTLKSDLSELETLCRELKGIGARLGLTQRCLFEVNLVLDEVFTNIISYGFKDEIEHDVSVSIACNHDTLTVTVEDDGVPFNPVERPEPQLPCTVEECRIGGLGIHLIKRLVDEACYSRRGGRNVLTLKKTIETT